MDLRDDLKIRKDIQHLSSAKLKRLNGIQLLEVFDVIFINDVRIKFCLV